MIKITILFCLLTMVNTFCAVTIVEEIKLHKIIKILLLIPPIGIIVGISWMLFEIIKSIITSLKTYLKD